MQAVLERIRLGFLATAAVTGALAVWLPPGWLALVSAFVCGAAVTSAVAVSTQMAMHAALVSAHAALVATQHATNAMVEAWAAEGETIRRRQDGDETRTVH